MNWLKKLHQKDSLILASVPIFIFAATMVGFDSDSIRPAFASIFLLGIVSLFGTIVLLIYVSPTLKDESRFPFFLFWAAIAFSLVIGG